MNSLKEFDQLVLELGVEDDVYYQGLINACKDYLDGHEFKEALITVKQLISIKENRKMLNKPL